MTKKTILKSFLWKFFERISVQLVSFVISLLLARLLQPSDYGVVALTTVFIALAEVFVTAGFGNALVQKKDAESLDFSSVFYFNSVFAFVLYWLLFICAPFISNFYGIRELTLIIRLLGIRIVLASVNSVQQAYVSRYMLFSKSLIATIWAALLSGIVGVIMAFRGYGAWALVVQNLLYSGVNTCMLWHIVKWRPTLEFSWVNMRKLFSYGWKLLIAQMISTMYDQARSLVIGKQYSSEDLAYYDKGNQLPSMIITNIDTTISSVLFPALSSIQEDVVKVREMTRKAVQIGSYIIWPIVIGLAVIAEPLIELLLTEKWLPCVPLMQMACLSYGFWPIHTANLQAIKALGRSDIYLKVDIIKKLVYFFILFIAMRYGVKAIAIGGIVGSVIGTFINNIPNKRLLQYTYAQQLKDMSSSLVVALLMGGIIYGIRFLQIGIIMQMCLQIISGITIYILLSEILKLKPYMYLKEMIFSVLDNKKCNGQKGV